MTLRNKPDYHRVFLGDVIKNIQSNEYDLLSSGLTKYVAGEHIESSKIRVTKHGDILNDIDKIGSAFHRRFSENQTLYVTRRAYLRKAAMVNFEGICSNTTLVLESNKTKLENELLPFILQSEQFVNYAIQVSVGSTNPYVRWRDLAKFQFFLPSNEIQQRISTVLWKIEESIVNSENLIETISHLKKSSIHYFMKKGLNHTKFHQTKLGKIPNEWKTTSIEEECTVGTGGTPSRKNPEFFQGDIPWVTTTELNYGVISNTNEHISKDGMESSNAKFHPKGSLVIAMYGLEADGTRGKCGILGIDSTTNQACAVIHPSKTIHIPFLFYYYQSLRDRLLSIAYGTKRQNLNLGIVKKLNIPFPPLDEQKNIAKIFSKFDNEINNLHNHIAHLRNMGKNIVEPMISGNLKTKEIAKLVQ